MKANFEETKRLIQKEGKNIKQVAAHFGCGNQTIYNLLNYNGTTFRKLSDGVTGAIKAVQTKHKNDVQKQIDALQIKWNNAKTGGERRSIKCKMLDLGFVQTKKSKIDANKELRKKERVAKAERVRLEKEEKKRKKQLVKTLREYGKKANKAYKFHEINYTPHDSSMKLLQDKVVSLEEIVNRLLTEKTK